MTGLTAVLPVRRWDRSKSRLDLADAERRLLSRAFSLDVLGVLTRSPLVDRVVVVTDEPSLVDLPDHVVVERHTGHRSEKGLREAVGRGVRWAERHRPVAPLVVVPGDLPALTATAFDEALGQLLQHERAFVPDAQGTGTTLLSAGTPGDLRAAYGPGSAHAHRRNGHEPCPDVDPRVRRDVDTIDDLRAALSLGVGTFTAAAWNACPPDFSRPVAERDIERRMLAARLTCW